MTTDSPDVLVIGGGNAALCAAIAARQGGARVVIVERAPIEWRGGNSKYTRNIRCAHGADRFMPGSYSEDELAADLASVTGEGSDTELTRLAVEQSRDAPGWMEANGVRWQPPLNGTLQLARTNKFFLGGGKALLNTYYAAAQRLGIEIAYDCTVVGISVNNDQATAVKLECGEREQIVRPKTVVAASGGFEANVEWLREYLGDGVDNYAIRGSRHNDGKVLRSLLDAGARECGNRHGYHAVAVDARGPRFEGGIITRVDSVPFSIMLNRNGYRFYDEGEDLWPKRYATWGRLIGEQPGQIAYSIFDSKVDNSFMRTAFRPYQASTVRELCAMLDLPLASVEKTVSEYNGAVRAGVYDPGKLDTTRTEGLSPPKSHWALRIDRPPFFAYPLRPGITFTYLGVAVDSKTRVLQSDGTPFTNIFAAGELMAGNILRRGYLAGFGMTIGTVFGRIAGKEAARVVAA